MIFALRAKTSTFFDTANGFPWAILSTSLWCQSGGANCAIHLRAFSRTVWVPFWARRRVVCGRLALVVGRKSKSSSRRVQLSAFSARSLETRASPKGRKLPMNGDCVREERKKKGDQEEGGRKKRSVCVCWSAIVWGAKKKEETVRRVESNHLCTCGDKWRRLFSRPNTSLRATFCLTLEPECHHWLLGGAARGQRSQCHAQLSLFADKRRDN